MADLYYFKVIFAKKLWEKNILNSLKWNKVFTDIQ